MSKHLYIISGCNGAGKTTASYTVLPEILKVKEFVNADEIARGLSPFNPEGMAIEAGRLMLLRIDELLLKGWDFAIETTLATRSYSRLVQRAQAMGYTVHLMFFWLNSINLAEERVETRVQLGGHNIAKDVIKRRYHLGLHNLFEVFIPIVDEWMIVDNSDLPREMVAEGGIKKEELIHNKVKFAKLKDYGKRETI
ncbi:hypothetical protein HMPREF6745_0311 [Prevotella sp. oral taxon 472 str. F0295]|nr:zeta toxin family protein [Prevotella sp. oral taxon 472]EEX54216.1 hypothetical protein HMPREF6745_0311 [Prevotella sp. oral taxon 472 str. F0295]